MNIMCNNCKAMFDYTEKDIFKYKHYNYRGSSEILRYVFCIKAKCCYHVFLDEPKTL